MHHRGTMVTPSGDTVTRGSVWVEQELAICAFTQHVLDRRLEVALYLQRGISHEGIGVPEDFWIFVKVGL